VQKKAKTQFLDFFLPNCILSYLKIVKGECRDKQKTQFLDFFAEPHPILHVAKDNTNRKQNKE